MSRAPSEVKNLELAETGVFSAPLPPAQKTDAKYSLGEAIRLLRKEKGISQEELAKKAQVDRSTIARVECGIFKSLSVEKLEGIAGAIGTDLKTLLIRSDSVAGPANVRSQLGRIEFALEYPEDGFRIVSHVPKRKEFFFGKIEIEPQKTIPSSKLPHPDQIYLHTLEGASFF
jgi:transcriptional regulator with XRE-family HTH domain